MANSEQSKDMDGHTIAPVLANIV